MDEIGENRDVYLHFTYFDYKLLIFKLFIHDSIDFDVLIKNMSLIAS